MKNRKKFLSIVLVVVLLLGLLLPIGISSMPASNIKEARKYAEENLLLREGIAGISQSEDKIIVYIEDETYKEEIPVEIKGFKTEVIVTGRIKALAMAESAESSFLPQYVPSVNRTDRVRPISGGISCGDPKITAGTLGVVTEDPYILSNAHVIAMDMNARFLRKGTPILQPGPYDGGTLDDQVGKLHKYIRIRFRLLGLWMPNYADAAIAELTTDEYLKMELLAADNQNTYTISGTTDVSVGDEVRKSGRTTGVTENEVTDTSATVIVWYTEQKWAIFKDQILVEEPFVEPGDSGSLVDKDGKFVGLVFAGSEYIAIVCKAKYIIEELGISV